MDVNHKVGIAKKAIDSIATHYDAGKDDVLNALHALVDHIKSGSEKFVANKDAAAAAVEPAKE